MLVDHFKCICQPQSLFFRLLKARPQFLIKGISSLKPLECERGCGNLLQSLGQALGPASMHTPS